jgi:hypothetical protein
VQHLILTIASIARAAAAPTHATTGVWVKAAADRCQQQAPTGTTG